MTKEADRIVGRKIFTIRTNRGMTQEKLAELSGFKSKSSITLIEAGERGVSQTSLVRIARALNIDPAELLAVSSPKNFEYILPYLEHAEDWQIKAVKAILNIKV